MQKRILYIVLAVALLIIVSIGIFQLFRKKDNSSTQTPTTSASPTTSEAPLFGGGNDTGNSDALFSGTPDPNATNSGSNLTINSRGLCPTQWKDQTDSDSDSLPDSVETIYKTDPAKSDTDGDGYKDGEEVQNGYDPLKAGSARLDSDNDGLTDDQECKWNTDPFNEDTDRDGYKDGSEVQNGFDPAKAGDGKGSDALPEKRAQLSDTALRPNVNSSNYTEGLAAILLGDTPTSQIGQKKVTPEQVKQALAVAKLDLTLPATNIRELAVTQTNTREDIATYLTKIDSLKPAQLLDTNNLTTALTNAFYGNTQGIISVRSNLSNYERTLLAVPVPPSATQHMALLVSTTRFLNTRLATIQEFGKSDPTKAYLAARELQEGLPSNITQVQNLRTALLALIN